MGKFIKRSAVEAVQVTGVPYKKDLESVLEANPFGPELPDWVQYHLYTSRILNYCERQDQPGLAVWYIESNRLPAAYNGIRFMRPGDWLVCDGTGLEVMKDEDFQTMYCPSPEPGSIVVAFTDGVCAGVYSNMAEEGHPEVDVLNLDSDHPMDDPEEAEIQQNQRNLFEEVQKDASFRQIA